MAGLGQFSPTDITGDESTVSYLLSRVLSRGSIYRKTELITFFPRWLNDFRNNKSLSPRLAELLTRVLRPFGTPSAHKRTEDIKVPEDFPAAQKWMVELEILMDDKADERFMQNLESLPDRVISFEELCLQSEEEINNDFLVVDSHQTVRFDYSMREVMTRGDKNEMKKHPDVFYVTGAFAWTVKSPYWNVALATDDAGNRFLSNNVLDFVLPKWRQILSGDTVPTARYGVADSFRQWLARERQKSIDLGKSWPERPMNIVSSASKPKSSEPKSVFMSRLRSSGPTRTTPIESIHEANESEQIEVLREILSELKDLKLMIRNFLPSREEIQNLEIPTPELPIHGSWQQPYPPVPQGPSYVVTQPYMPQDQRSSPQFNSTPLDADWQPWNVPYNTPSRISAQETGYIRRS